MSEEQRREAGCPPGTYVASDWDRTLARIIHERCAFIHYAPAASRPFLVAAGFDTALRAVLKTSPGRVLSEGPRIGPESKPEGRTIRGFHE